VRTKLFLFTKQSKDITLAKLEQQITLPSNIYTHCSELPFDIFIECEEHKIYNRLIKFGSCSPTVLNSAWETIYFEYCELVKNNTNTEVANLMQIIGKISSKLVAINSCLQILQCGLNNYAIKVLNDFGFSYEFTDKTIKSDIDKIKSNIKTLTVELQQAQNKFDAIIEKNKKNDLSEVQNKHYYIKQLDLLAKYRKVGVIHAKDITTLQFTIMLNDYLDYVQIMNKKQQ
jgi:hypothetical protein